VTARILDGKAIADQIRTEVADRVRALAERGVTPVPGGVGPMTVSMLLVNTVAAAEAQAFGR
jgi:methylenetetrahydrofolate dehydrogenase (NADP+)/methenyltetrahydrofolate cyclohydrolase